MKKKGKKGGEERKQAREKSPREEPPSKTMKGGEERKSGGKNEDFQPVAFPSQTMGGLDPVLWGPLCCHNKGFLTGLGGLPCQLRRDIDPSSSALCGRRRGIGGLPCYGAIVVVDDLRNLKLQSKQNVPS